MGRGVSEPKVRRRPQLPFKRWITRVEFEALMQSGVFEPDERLELLAGELTRRESVGTLHAVAVTLLSEILSRLLPSGMHLRVQLPLALGEYDEPFPDVAVVVGSPRDYLQQHPSTAALVVEVAEASLKTDREVKGSLYASTGIPEYWIVNLKERVVEVYREPTPDRKAVYGMAYRAQMVLGVGDTVSPLFAPNATIGIADLLP